MIKYALFYFIASTVIAEHGQNAPNCTEDDMTLIMNTDFTKNFRSCARRHLAGARATTRCIVERYPLLHTECAGCFGAFAACAKKNCLSPCMSDSESRECIECGISRCGSEWEQCSGRNISLFPQENNIYY